MKYIIFDSGPIINFAMNGLLPVLKKLRKGFNGEFLVSKYWEIDDGKLIVDTTMVKNLSSGWRCWFWSQYTIRALGTRTPKYSCGGNQ